MASLTRGTRAELRRIHGMLETIANLAEHAELAEQRQAARQPPRGNTTPPSRGWRRSNS